MRSSSKFAARAAHSPSLYAMHRATEVIRLLATVSWSDSGLRISVQEIVHETVISDAK